MKASKNSSFPKTIDVVFRGLNSLENLRQRNRLGGKSRRNLRAGATNLRLTYLKLDAQEVREVELT